MTDLQKVRNSEIMELWADSGKIDLGRVVMLLDMAHNGEEPDESFSDDERFIWDEIMDMANYHSNV